MFACSDSYGKLLRVFGNNVAVPGVLFDDKWVAFDDENLEDLLGEYWTDKILSSGNHPPQAQDASKGEIHFDPLLGQPKTTSFSSSSGTPSSSDKVTILRSNVKQRALIPSPFADEASRASSITSKIYAKICLPDGTFVSVGSLLRYLLDNTKHRSLTRYGKPYYYVRGEQALETWSALFFQDGVAEEEVVNFVRVLIERGLVHNYTPNSESLAQAVLVLQPLRQPHALNTFLKWPSLEPIEEEDPMDLILSLSRMMDDICASGMRQDDIQELEARVAQLQVVTFPNGSVLRVTFGLNLFNLIMRHAMLIADSREWKWPETLREMHQFCSNVGYNIGGEFISLAHLQNGLLGTTFDERNLVEVQSSSWLQRWLCRDSQQATGIHYEAAVVRNDPRIIFATTWGTHSSPCVSTLYPNRLGEGLQTAAEHYCRLNVVVGADRVVLPPLLSWFRADFGYQPEQVLFSILTYLSPEQLNRVRALRDSGSFQILFDTENYRWKRGLRAPLPHLPPPVRPSQEEVPDDTKRGLSRLLCYGAPAGSGTQRRRRRSLLPICRRPSVGDEQPVFGTLNRKQVESKLPQKPEPVIREEPSATDEFEEEDMDAWTYDPDAENIQLPRTVVSEITYGSEFEDLLLGYSRN